MMRFSHTVKPKSNNTLGNPLHYPAVAFPPTWQAITKKAPMASSNLLRDILRYRKTASLKQRQRVRPGRCRISNKFKKIPRERPYLNPPQKQKWTKGKPHIMDLCATLPLSHQHEPSFCGTWGLLTIPTDHHMPIPWDYHSLQFHLLYSS